MSQTARISSLSQSDPVTASERDYPFTDNKFKCSHGVKRHPKGGLPSPPYKRTGNLDAHLDDGEWEMILNAMMWTEGPGWFDGKLVFSDTRLGKIFNWDPETGRVGVQVRIMVQY